MYRTTRPIFSSRIIIGDARSEGRQPSHDGEYMSLYADDQGNWVVGDNGGFFYCNDYSYCDAVLHNFSPTDEQIEEAEEFDDEAYAFANAPGDNLIDEMVVREGQVGHAVLGFMIERGWLIEEDD